MATTYYAAVRLELSNRDSFDLLDGELAQQLLACANIFVFFYAFLFSSYEPVRDRRTDGRTVKTRIVAY